MKNDKTIVDDHTKYKIFCDWQKRYKEMEESGNTKEDFRLWFCKMIRNHKLADIVSVAFVTIFLIAVIVVAIIRKEYISSVLAAVIFIPAAFFLYRFLSAPSRALVSLMDSIVKESENNGVELTDLISKKLSDLSENIGSEAEDISRDV